MLQTKIRHVYDAESKVVCFVGPSALYTDRRAGRTIQSRDIGFIQLSPQEVGKGSRPSLADLGLWWAKAERWQARARLAPSRSFNVRLAEADTLDGIKALVAKATLDAQHAQARNDRAGHMIAVAQRVAAKRRRALLIGGVESDLRNFCDIRIFS